MKISARLLLLAVVTMLILPTVAMGQFFLFRNPMIGKQAVDFQLENLSGQMIKFSQARADKPAILIFWATWCPYCQDELSHLSQRVAQFNTNDVKVFLVNVQEEPSDVKSFMQQIPLPFEVILDRESAVSNQYGVNGLPSVFLINRDGVVLSLHSEIPANYRKILSKSK